MSSIIIAFLLIALVIIICLVLVSVNNKHKQKAAVEIDRLFTRLKEEMNLSFSRKEIQENFIIGLDKPHKTLLYVIKTDNTYSSLVIDLEQLKSCSKNKVYKSINMGTDKKQKFETMVDKVVLEFDYIDKREPVQISFYEAGRDHLFDMNDLVQKASSWEIILTKIITNKVKTGLDKENDAVAGLKSRDFNSTIRI
jgi:hypothetical protein